MNGCASIELSNLIIGYTHNRMQRPIMGAVNATLHKGELVALVGANGAGKSTLLRTLSAFQAPLSGTITYPDGRTNIPSADELSATVALVLTTGGNIHNMSVREVVGLGRTPYTNFLGRIRRHDKEIIENAMRAVNIEPLADREINTLSDGERQKAMIAKALAQETDIILLDEPTAFLDFKSRVELFKLLNRLAAEKGKSILVSTHDLELALQLADRMWLIHNGNLHTGSIKELAYRGILSQFIDCKEVHYNTTDNKIELR